jgi:hypothetical protein
MNEFLIQHQMQLGDQLHDMTALPPEKKLRVLNGMEVSGPHGLSGRYIEGKKFFP